MPVARLRLGAREVWACVWLGRRQVLLLDPPVPLEASRPQPAATGMFGRLRHQIGAVLQGDVGLPSPWLQRPLRGSLRWLATLPLGASGDVTHCALDEAEWMSDATSQSGARPFPEHLLGDGELRDGALVFANLGGLRTKQLSRDDRASYAWLDPSASDAFGATATEQVWALVWQDGDAIVPLARLEPLGQGRPPRLIHLVPD